MSTMAAKLNVLVLDVDGIPLQISPWKKVAKKLAIPGKVEVVEFSRDKTIRLVDSNNPMPSVLRVLRRFRRDRRAVKFSRLNIYLRDGFICQYCRDRFLTEELNFDHVIPRSRGGRTCWENIITCCISCNSEKANRTPEEAGFKLLRKPTKPWTLPAADVDMGNQRMPEEWNKYWSITLDR